ncbi:putative cytokinetic ring protein SteA [Kribbella solani]|uniref:Putative membrane-anchored protein n=1 Tax=Kribbella solani TaxID=236067 RepID=A0A841DIY8_9ACTN|nr:putative cytokinetic ring protein SteA [Kribbella solani]MBB5976670.1 putative membrane-anchored protein [Kribbella solani]MDX2971449.1 putative cytokinetic ring protein SteA [Kribbella solani]MDX3006431.1 putative cytokinetic ring protein SteA [Kribbella solani]
MKLPSLRRARPTELPGVTGVVRLDRRTKNLTKRLKPGEIAVIDHVDLDRVSAEALVDCKVAGVVNVADSISGRYPNLGPEILVEAGIPLVDGVGREVFSILHEGERVRLDEGTLYRGQEVVAKGMSQDSQSVAELMDDARSGLSTQLEAFTANTLEYLRREKDLLLDGVGVPEIHTPMEAKHVLIVVRGYDYRDDLVALKPYIREYRPVLIGVDGGADALVENGYVPDLIVGDMDSVKDETLKSGAEVVVHAYRDGRAPGSERLERLGVESIEFPATGTSEDVAMLLADSKGASLIVAVGTHNSLVEFLDKGRSGMASTFITRLRVGAKLVDAKGVGRLYRSRVSTFQVVALIVAGLFAVGMAMIAIGADDVLWSILRARWSDFVYWIRELFT